MQDKLECCGVGLQACYSFPATWQSELHTGSVCTPVLDAAVALHMSLNPDYDLNQDAALTVQLQQLNQGQNYFCEATVKTTVQSGTLYVAIVLGVLSLLQFVAFVLGNVLICCVGKEDGGFAEVDYETGKLETPMVAFVNNTKEITTESKQFANRVSTRVGLGMAHGANRMSMQFGFQPPINEERFKPPPGMPPPGLGGGRGGAPPSGPPPGITKVTDSGGDDFGPEYAKYDRMKKSGLPSGAVRNAMERDGVAIPAGFLSEDEPVMATPTVRKPAPPPVQAVKNFATRMSSRVQQTSNRMSMNVKGMFAPPPPPPGFGGLPAESPPPGFGYEQSSAMDSGFGGATMNPHFRGGGGGGMGSPIQEQEFAAIQAPPPTKAPPPGKAAAPKAPPKAAAPAPKAAPKPAPKAAAKAAPAAASKPPGGAPGFLGDIGGGGGFQLKKTVTNDRSAPNLSAKG
ncbi:hypothetical protein BASA81_012646 [Batrachochytrium salamandrivorans]|nr:hypothetical protein BASA81_012646 [Batrachochytrium salamandrivorans]